MSFETATMSGAVISSNTRLAEEFLARFTNGEICLHPTDTIPGLTFDPHHTSSIDLLMKIKGRESTKSFIGLVAHQEFAEKNWLPLPDGWQDALKKLWPGPLSVIWRASGNAPKSMVTTDGMIALRCPLLSESDSWFNEVLVKLIGVPLPTSSVNRSGETAADNWVAAVEWCDLAGGIYVPPVKLEHKESYKTQASSLIRIADDGNWELLRAGPVTQTKIKEAFRRDQSE